MPVPAVCTRSCSPLIFAALFLAALSPALAQYSQGGDPPTRVARIGWAQGNVSLEPAGSDSFSGAQLNYPLSAGDRLYVDGNSLSELQTSGWPFAWVRLRTSPSPPLMIPPPSLPLPRAAFASVHATSMLRQTTTATPSRQ